MRRFEQTKRNIVKYLHFHLGVIVCVLAILFPSQSRSENFDVLELIYSDSPIPIYVQVGVPFELRFESHMEFGIPTSLSELLSVENISSTVYLTALQPFPKTRLVVKQVGATQSIVLNLEAGYEETEFQTVAIKRSKRPQQPSLLLSYSPVELTRFVAQQVFAPKRLLPVLKGLVRVRLQNTSPKLSRDPEVESKPIVSWRSDEHYVTAVMLKNSGNVSKALEPRTLKGTWMTSTFHHSRLLPQGKKGDSSVVYLISELPYDQALVH